MNIALVITIIIAIIAYINAQYTEGGPLGWANARTLIGLVVLLFSLGVIFGILISMFL